MNEGQPFKMFVPGDEAVCDACGATRFNHLRIKFQDALQGWIEIYVCVMLLPVFKAKP